MLKTAKHWVAAYLVVVLLLLIGVGSLTVAIDPYFHYHKPLESIYYALSNQRSQNDGILKHFDYDAIITGTSMAENFKASECNEIFGVNAIKVCFSGASYKEINDNLKVAFRHNEDIKMIVRALDTGMILADKDKMRYDLGEYPTHLYDDNLFNDVKYVFNKEILFSLSVPLLEGYMKGIEGGITDFDSYSNWMRSCTFGKNTVLENVAFFEEPTENKVLTDEERKMIQDNIEQNVIALAQAHPETEFYYFFTPYSAVWWGDMYQKGYLERQIEAEKYAIELILDCENIKFFSWNNRFEIITDLNNYKDLSHYGEWINSLILNEMDEEKNILTWENYGAYIEDMKTFYSTFDYNSLFEQYDDPEM